jgi:hypothetical protein
VIEPGVSSALEELLECSRPQETSPAYDLQYLRWQIEQCPVVQSVTCYVEPRHPLAGALAWRHKCDPRNWRLALWARSDSHIETRDVLEAVLDFVFQQGAHRISVIASHLDRERLGMLRARGFLESGRPRSLFSITLDRPVNEEPAGLSFLDTDLAYRF